MNSGIPARDLLVQPTGQITTIWLIFFERLYSIYLQAEQNNEEGIAAVRKIADDAYQLAQQANSINTTQQNQIKEILKKINGQIITEDQFNGLVQKVNTIEQDIQSLTNQFNSLSQQFSSTNISNQQKFASINQQINNLAQLVETKLDDAPADGKIYGRKDAEWYEVIQVSLSLPFWLVDGSQSNIQLTPEYQLPFWLSDGTQQNIQMVVT
ncbi:hypothetical protein F4U02_13215 [Acinetobacter haemolyticus]|uniref:hypothetical protein n=1 Tax=Acinetobacter haemolyticus TaxID=29430 RepID=UPI0012986853|nr:hypothetical protein [Acinetobacter haemolyticus]MQZ31944.1 hypothetical protein [Acinetobacter haemolyticus]